MRPYRSGRDAPCAAVTLPVQHATSAAVINPRLEMSIRWARLAGGSRRSAIPVITTIAVSIAEIADAAPFGDFHDRAIFTQINQRARGGGERSSAAQEGGDGEESGDGFHDFGSLLVAA